MPKRVAISSLLTVVLAVLAAGCEPSPGAQAAPNTADCKCWCLGAEHYTNQIECSDGKGGVVMKTQNCWKKKNSCNGSVCQTVCETSFNVCNNIRGGKCE